MHDGTVSGPNCIARFEDVRAVISVLLSTTCNPTFAVSVTLKHLEMRLCGVGLGCAIQLTKQGVISGNLRDFWNPLHLDMNMVC